MSAFEYEALDSRGRPQVGVVMADTARLARKDLRMRHLTPLSVTPSVQRAVSWSSKTKVNLRQRISTRDLALMTRQLATMLDAGAPLEGTLQTLAQQTEKPFLQKIIARVRSDVVEGYPFAEALGRQGSAFSPFYRALVSAGEASGSLAPVLDRLAMHLEKSEKIRSKVIAACVYPAVLAVVALGVVAALVTFVVPKVVEQFDSVGQDLPGLTKFVIALSEIAQGYGLYVLIGLSAVIILSAHLLRLPNIRRVFDRSLLALPIAGRLMRDLQAARLSRTLSTLISCGAPIVDGLKAAKQTMQNAVLQDAVVLVIKKVEEGGGLSKSLEAAHVFPPLLVYMAAIGESSGRLDTMLSKAADHLESEFEAFTATALSLLEPIIIVLMGGVVAAIVLAILLPILRLNALALM